MSVTEIAAPALPRWDMTPVFPSLTSPEFAAAFDKCVADLAALGGLFDRHAVRRRDRPAVDADFARAFDEVADALNAFRQQVWTLFAYIGCFASTDARDDEAKSRESLLEAQTVPFDLLVTRYVAWVGTSDIDALLLLSETARAHEFAVRKAHKQAARQMTEAEEALASELAPSGISAWARLHGTMTALLTAEVALPDGPQTLPMSQVRALSNDGSREVRRAAFEAEIRAWETVSIPLAAALNGVKGYQQTVRTKRGYEDDTAPTYLMNNMDGATLEAMHRACAASFPDFRRYMDLKAKALGLERLAWYDLNAPLGRDSRRYSWPEAEAFILDNFARYSPRLGDFAARAFREQWVDAEPRVGKEGGAYCTGPLPGVSRIFMNFDGSFNSVSTLAHELGHAYHNLNLEARTTMQRSTPMTLAETASIFCETLTFDAALQQAAPDERLVLLDTALQRDLGVVVDIHSRFLFEKAVFAKRAERDLTVAEFDALMTDAQRQAYGENLDPLHPRMWAVKGHYYGPLFYNYPYTFGLLFALGLYARFRQEPDAFRARYDDLLSSTGLADARSLAARFGIDITTEDFWQSSLDIVRSNIAEFERLVG